MTDAMKYEQMVHRVVRDHPELKVPSFDYEDMEHVAWVGVCKGLQSFDPTKGDNEASWVAANILFELRNSYKRNAPVASGTAYYYEVLSRIAQKKNKSIDQVTIADLMDDGYSAKKAYSIIGFANSLFSVSVDEAEYKNEMPTEEDVQDYVLGNVIKQDLMNLLAQLPGQEGAVLDMLYGVSSGSAMKCGEVSKELGLSTGAVRGAQKRGISRLRAMPEVWAMA